MDEEPASEANFSKKTIYYLLTPDHAYLADQTMGSLWRQMFRYDDHFSPLS